MTELEPISPQEAKRLYIEARRDELTTKTIEMQEYHLRYFSDWCDNQDIDNLNDVTGRDIHQYRLYCQQEELSRATIRTQLSTLRCFTRWCGTIDAVTDRLHEKVVPPSLTSDDRRETMLTAERAKKILNYLNKFNYASRDHAIFYTLWQTGMRMGTLRSIDVGDYHSDEKYLAVRHRPDTDTPLKNGTDGERSIAITQDLCYVLDDYTEHNRIAENDAYGREPLFTTIHGRAGKQTIRRTADRVTHPCLYSGDCPHGRNEENCKAVQVHERACQCPSSRSPHPIRRGAITHFLRNDVDERVVSDRMDVSSEVISKHYDQRSEKEQMESRRSYLDNI